MRILLYGYYNPNFVNTIVYRQQALLGLGHEVIFFDESAYLIPGRLRVKFPMLQQWDLQRLNNCLVSLVKKKKPDLCLMVGGHNVLPTTIAQIKALGVGIALWTTDVPVNFKNILDGASFYDHLFCAGTEAADIFKQHGFKNVTWVPFGCNPNFHYRLALDADEQEKYGKDIVFIGSFYPNRANVLEAIADYDVGVWGPYWEKLAPESPLKPKAVNIKMNYDQWVRIFNASKINIVIHYQDGKVPCHQASPKLFEAMACGCFVLTDRQKDVQALFEDKKHLVFFDDDKDLRMKIQYYLEHDEERKRIAEAGYQEVIALHTYQDRLQQILGVLSKKQGFIHEA